MLNELISLPYSFYFLNPHVQEEYKKMKIKVKKNQSNEKKVK
jgi:hypothetical protein